MRVTTDGKNLVSHAGTALLSELADRNGLTEAMSVAMAGCGITWPTHDPGVVLTHLAVAIADGADCLADMASLLKAELFGPVASIATAWRAVEATTVSELRAIPDAVATGRAVVWAAAPPGDSLILDFDATLQNSYSEKQDAAPTYKHGFGFFPLGVWCDATGEPLAATLRPGNAGANDADDHANCSTGPRPDCPRTTRPATSPTTIPRSSPTPSWCGPTRPGPPTISWRPSDLPTATSPSDSPSTREYATPWSWPKRRTGSRPQKPTAPSGMGPGSPN
jgi:hypothetical protein